MTEYTLKSAAVTREQDFALNPGPNAREALAERLGIRGVRKLSFKGRIAPDGKSDLTLEAALGATVVQDCVVTGDPVKTRIDEPVRRRFLASMVEPESEEAEMPEDDTAEPLPENIVLADIMAEALALALPSWPRAEGVGPVDVTVTEPGKSPMTEEETRPFAGLKALRDQLKRGE